MINDLASEGRAPARRGLVHDVGPDPEDFVEVRYEDLDQSPLAQIENIYDRLALGDFPGTSRYFSEYLDSVRGYRKNVFEADTETLASIERHWLPQIERWGYQRPE